MRRSTRILLLLLAVLILLAALIFRNYIFEWYYNTFIPIG